MSLPAPVQVSLLPSRQRQSMAKGRITLVILGVSMLGAGYLAFKVL